MTDIRQTYRELAETMRLAHHATAGSEDDTINGGENYERSAQALRAMLALAYPHVNAYSVYDAWLNSMESIADCVAYVERTEAWNEGFRSGQAMGESEPTPVQDGALMPLRESARMLAGLRAHANHPDRPELAEQWRDGYLLGHDEGSLIAAYRTGEPVTVETTQH